MENNVNCEEMRFMKRNLVDVEDPPRQWRQKFLLMSLKSTSVFPQRGRDDAVGVKTGGSRVGGPELCV